MWFEFWWNDDNTISLLPLYSNSLRGSIDSALSFSILFIVRATKHWILLIYGSEPRLIFNIEVNDNFILLSIKSMTFFLFAFSLHACLTYLEPICLVFYSCTRNIHSNAFNSVRIYSISLKFYGRNPSWYRSCMECHWCLNEAIHCNSVQLCHLPLCQRINIKQPNHLCERENTFDACCV